jgi:hypothetical protein
MRPVATPADLSQLLGNVDGKLHKNGPGRSGAMDGAFSSARPLAESGQAAECLYFQP